MARSTKRLTACPKYRTEFHGESQDRRVSPTLGWGTMTARPVACSDEATIRIRHEWVGGTYAPSSAVSANTFDVMQGAEQTRTLRPACGE
jgi:hypothetical protein